MQISHINLFDFQGGAARIAWELMKNMNKREFQSGIFARHIEKSSENVFQIEESSSEWQKKILSQHRQKKLYDLGSASLFSVFNHSFYQASDIVHLHCINGGYFSFFLLPYLAAKPMVWTLHDPQAFTAGCLFPEFCNRWVEDYCKSCPMDKAAGTNAPDRFALQQMKEKMYQISEFTIVSPSKWLDKQVQKSIMKEKESKVIYNGINVDVFSKKDKTQARLQLGLSLERTYILFVSHGGLKYQIKGGNYLVKAIQQLLPRYPNLTLLIVGGKEENLPVPTISIPFVNDMHTMSLCYSAADIFVSASLSESFGLSVCEAMSCGTPVIATAVGGVPEIIEDQKTGWLVPPRRADLLAQKIHQLLQNQENLAAVTQKGMEKARNMFTINKMVNEYKGLYESLLEGRTRSGMKDSKYFPANSPKTVQTPKVSVIMPVYNGELYLREAIDSVLKQTFIDFEFLIIDDGSTDNSLHIIQSYNDSRIVIIQNPSNLGLIETLNRGIRAAQGRYIARMDCDDICLPERLNKQVAFLDSNESVGICGTWIEAFGSTNRQVWQYPVRSNEIKSKLLFRSAFAHPTVMIRRSVLDEHNFFYEADYPHAEDYRLWTQIAHYTDLANLPEVLLLYRISDNQISSKHREAQLNTTLRVQTEQIKLLGITPTYEEIRVHFYASLGKLEGELKNLEVLGKWMIKLQKGNVATQYFDKNTFTHELKQVWQLICKNYFPIFGDNVKLYYERYNFLIGKEVAPKVQCVEKSKSRSIVSHGKARPRVFYVGMKYDYGKPEQGFSFEHYNFYHTLANMDVDLKYFDFLSIEKEYGKDIMNEMLIKEVRKFNPDLAFFVLFEENFYLDAIKQLPCITFNWFCDDHWRYDNFSSKWAAAFNFISTTDEDSLVKYRRDGYENVILTQWACNHFLYKPVKIGKEYAVSFVGQPHGVRRQAIQYIRDKGVNIECFGQGWPNGRVEQEEMIRVFSNTNINLNLSNSSQQKVSQIKGRNFEIPGCGGFLLTEKVPFIEKYYNIQDEIICYENIDDLIEKIRFYSLHDNIRKRIALKGYTRTLQDHTYEKRFLDIFSRMKII